MSDNVQHFVVENNNNNNNIGLTLNDYACQMTIYFLEDTRPLYASSMDGLDKETMDLYIQIQQFMIRTHSICPRNIDANCIFD